LDDSHKCNNVTPLTIKNVPQDLNISLTRKVQMYCYPTLIDNEDLPIIRHGNLATPPYTKFDNERPSGCISISTFKGASGSPVYIDLYFENTSVSQL